MKTPLGKLTGLAASLLLVVGSSLVGIASGAATAAQAPKPGSLGQFADATSAPAPSLDPTTTLAASAMEIYLYVFDPLVTYNENFQVIPDLAKHWTVTGHGTVYTFALAHGIKFQNGQLMTSTDVVASIERAIRMGESSSTFQSVVKSVTANGPYTVVITLKKPYGGLLALLGNPLPELPIMPAKYANMKGTLNPPDLIGTGPYEISKWIPDQYTLLTRFSGYTPAEHFAATGLGGDRIAYYKSIKFEPIAQPEARLAGLERGQFQYAEGLPYTAYRQLQANHALRPGIISESADLAFWLNQRSGPMANVFFRQAMVAAINDRAVLNAAASGVSQFYGKNMNGSLFWPEQTTWYDPSAGAAIYNHPNVAKAKGLLKRAGYHGQPIVIITNHTYPYMYEEAVVVADELQAVGINAKLKVYDWPGAIAAFERPTGWSMFASSAIFQADPIGWYVIIAPNAPLAPGFTSTAMGQLLTEGAAATSTDQRRAIYRKVQTLIWTRVPSLIVGRLSSLDGYESSIHGYKPYFTPRFWNVW